MKKKPMTKKEEMQKIIRLYREETGKSECTMHDVAQFAVVAKGMAASYTEGPHG